MGKGQHNIGADHADRWRKNAGKRRRRWRPEYLFALVLVPLAVFLAFNADTLGIGPSLAPVGLIDGTSTEGAGSSGSCEIKGNINIDSGE
ncbi:hypothetical protein, partial [Mesorhizobium sp. dw_380]|uniref:hypothetical protein n=1 Tax=Mesorhizobium sp. dw_380 TaxID=2812001 RepID=UPI001BDF20D6